MNWSSFLKAKDLWNGYKLKYKKILNIFNDVLPLSNKYFDLSSSIEKLLILNSLKKRACEIFFKWKNQLGLILEFFKNKSDELAKIIRKEIDKKKSFREELKILIDSLAKYVIAKDFWIRFETNRRKRWWIVFAC